MAKFDINRYQPVPCGSKYADPGYWGHWLQFRGARMFLGTNYRNPAFDGEGDFKLGGTSAWQAICHVALAWKAHVAD